MEYYNSFAAGLVLLALAGCSDPKTEKSAAQPAAQRDGEQRVEIVGGSCFFKPDRVAVRLNAPVELTLRKEPGATPHDFVLKAPEAGMDIELTLEESPTVVRFTPTRAGTYAFYCSKQFLFHKSHRERGMKGTIDVVDATPVAGP